MGNLMFDITSISYEIIPDSKVYGANMGPTWDR